MKLQKRIIVIIDAYSSGKFLAPAFFGHGYACVHVDSNVGLPLAVKKSFHDCCFIDKIVMDANGIPGVLNKLSKYDIKAVIAGSEMGVNIADMIADQLDVVKNDVLFSLHRRDKFMMVDALNKANVSHTPQFKSSNLDEIVNWYTNSGIKKVILKPVMAGLSENVSICCSEHEISHAFQAAFGKKNITGKVNDAMVIQQFHEGKEYIVNSVSSYGEHFITDIWIGIGGIKDKISTDEYAELIHREDPIFATLSSYTQAVLRALKIDHGPAHTEIKMTIEGPRLIEIGARLGGGMDYSVMEEAQGYSQLSLMVNAIVFPETFKKYCEMYKKMPQQCVRFVYLCANVAGKIVKKPNLNRLLAIPSVHSISFSLGLGEHLKKTNESLGRPGYAFMFAENEEKLETDYKKFRQYEEEMYLDMLGDS